MISLMNSPFACMVICPTWASFSWFCMMMFSPKYSSIWYAVFPMISNCSFLFGFVSCSFNTYPFGASISSISYLPIPRAIGVIKYPSSPVVYGFS